MEKLHRYLVHQAAVLTLIITALLMSPVGRAAVITHLRDIPFAFIDANGEFVEVLGDLVSVETNNKRGVMKTIVHAEDVPNDTGRPVKWSAEDNPMSPGPLLGFGQLSDRDGDGVPDAFFVTYDWFMLITPEGRALLVAHFTAEDEVPLPF